MSFNSKFNRRRLSIDMTAVHVYALMLVKTTSLTHLMPACRCSDCVPVHLGTPPTFSLLHGPPSSPTERHTNDVDTTDDSVISRELVSSRCCCCYSYLLRCQDGGGCGGACCGRRWRFPQKGSSASELLLVTLASYLMILIQLLRNISFNDCDADK